MNGSFRSRVAADQLGIVAMGLLMHASTRRIGRRLARSSLFAGRMAFEDGVLGEVAERHFLRDAGIEEDVDAGVVGAARIRNDRPGGVTTLANDSFADRKLRIAAVRCKSLLRVWLGRAIQTNGKVPAPLRDIRRSSNAPRLILNGGANRRMAIPRSQGN